MPVVRWIRRTLWVPTGAGVLAVVLAVIAALVWRGFDADGIVLAVVVGGLLLVPAVGVGLFVNVLGDLQRLPGDGAIGAGQPRCGEGRAASPRAVSCGTCAGPGCWACPVRCGGCGARSGGWTQSVSPG